MDVSIIIVNYNTLKMTKECIDSIYQYTKNVFFEVILVDNASGDGSKDFFEKDTRIKYIYNKENLGFGKANNLGLLEAQGKYIFLLNSDTLLIENSVLRFFNFMENFADKQKIGVCGCRLINQELQIIHSYNYFPSVKSILLGGIKKIVNRSKAMLATKEDKDFNRDGFFEVDYITGADLFFKRDLINELGGLFDPKFFMYFEETDLQYRIFRSGYKRCIIDGTHIIHLEGGSQKDSKHQRNYFRHYCLFLESLNYFLEKNYSYIKRLLYRFFFGLLVLPRFAAHKMSNKERLKIVFMGIGINNQ